MFVSQASEGRQSIQGGLDVTHDVLNLNIQRFNGVPSDCRIVLVLTWSNSIGGHDEPSAATRSLDTPVGQKWL